MKWINKNKGIINVILICSIMIYNLFLDSISINFDYGLIALFFIINIKNIYKFFKKNIVLFILIVLFVMLNLFQVIFHSEITGIYSFIYNCRFMILTLFPFMILITLNEIGLSKKHINIVKKVFTISLLIIMIYGIITYIFNINLYTSGMHVLNDGRGRITSFFANPNGYGLFLVFSLIYYLFNKNMNQYLKWIIVALIITSICLTFGRTMYFLMALTIIIYIIYNLIKKDNKNKIKNISLIIGLVFVSLYLPNNNYFFISLTYKFDQVTNLEITKPVYKIVDTIVLLDYDTDSEKLYQNIKRNENNEYSSSSTRSLFKNTALELYKKNKVMGVGYSNYFNEMDKMIKAEGIDYVDGHLPHNFYVLLLVSTGIIGTTIFCLIIAYIGFYIYRYNNYKTVLPLFIYLVYLLSNTQGDFMLATYFVYIIIALAMNMEYNKKVIKEKNK